MREIHPQALDREAFRPYGDFMDLLRVPPDREAGGGQHLCPGPFEAPFGRADARLRVRGGVSECERVISALGTTSSPAEGILPLDGDIDIFVGPSSFRVDPETVVAFRVPKGTFVRLNPGVLHGRQFVVDSPEVNVLILLPERTFGNDCASSPRRARADPHYTVREGNHEFSGHPTHPSEQYTRSLSQRRSSRSACGWLDRARLVIQQQVPWHTRKELPMEWLAPTGCSITTSVFVPSGRPHIGYYFIFGQRG